MKNTPLIQIHTGSTRRHGGAAVIKLITLMSGLVLAASSLSAQVLYQETFTNSGASNAALSTVGWSAYNTSAATSVSGNSLVYLPNLAGNPNATNGFLAINTTGPTNRTDYAAVTTYSDFTGGTPMNLNNTTITWVQGNNTMNTSVRLLIQTGGDGSVGTGNWYASSTAFTTDPAVSSAANFASATTADLTKTITFSLTASNWNAFTLDPGTAMSLGSTLGADLSTSTITGIGFYVSTPTSSNSVSRLDTLTVTVVPEPSAALLAGLGLAVTVFGFRRSTRIRQA